MTEPMEKKKKKKKRTEQPTQEKKKSKWSKVAVGIICGSLMCV